MVEDDRKSQHKRHRDYNQFSDDELCATSVDIIALNYNKSKCYCKYINSLIQPEDEKLELFPCSAPGLAAGAEAVCRRQRCRWEKAILHSHTILAH